eukprot:1950584-Alexandrium_andersonii.AAC.1
MGGGRVSLGSLWGSRAASCNSRAIGRAGARPTLCRHGLTVASPASCAIARRRQCASTRESAPPPAPGCTPPWTPGTKHARHAKCGWSCLRPNTERSGTPSSTTAGLGATSVGA